jgi:Putative heavy-metal-binding
MAFLSNGIWASFRESRFDPVRPQVLSGLYTQSSVGILLPLQPSAKSPGGDAFDLIFQRSSQMGADAVVGMRYDANEVMRVTEVLAYGHQFL